MTFTGEDFCRAASAESAAAYAAQSQLPSDSDHEHLWSIAHAPVEQLLSLSGIDNRRAATILGVPIRTLQSWTVASENRRTCPPWCRYLIACRLGLL